MTDVKYEFGGMDTSVGIEMPCPSCGAKTLFIGEGGHLSCSGTKCKEPSVEAAIANAIKEAEPKEPHGIVGPSAASAMTGHGNVRCVCGKVIRQCRCSGPHNTVTVSPCTHRQETGR